MEQRKEFMQILARDFGMSREFVCEKLSNAAKMLEAAVVP